MSKITSPSAYSQRYCAFVDFLGFSSAIMQNTLTPDEILSAMKKAENFSGGDEDLICVTQFSDSLVLSCPIDEDWALLTLATTIFYLNIELVQHGILLRGGISKGELFHKENLAFGPAFLRAYQLEQAAGTPRVIIDSKIIDDALWPDTMSRSERKDFINECLPKDADGWRYVDYLSSRHTGEFDAGPEGLQHHYATISDLIDLNRDSESPSIRTKYGWLENKLAAALK